MNIKVTNNGEFPIKLMIQASGFDGGLDEVMIAPGESAAVTKPGFSVVEMTGTNDAPSADPLGMNGNATSN